jgi:hypothetical protein
MNGSRSAGIKAGSLIILRILSMIRTMSCSRRMRGISGRCLVRFCREDRDSRKTNDLIINIGLQIVV